jgi:ketosteroid isomerase-like protein
MSTNEWRLIMRRIVLTILTLTALGCASYGSGTVDPRDEVLAALEAYHAAERAGDVPAILDAYSDDFADAQGTGKSVLLGFFQAIVDGGVLDDLEVDMAATEVQVDGDIAIVQPITYTTMLGTNTYAYRLAREEDGVWRFVYSEQLM